VRLITKGSEPTELTRWKKSHQKDRYQNLDETPTGRETRQAIRKTAIKEQFGLCAYCCKEINLNNSTNEHLASQSRYPNRTLDFKNIVASCNTPKRCNSARGSAELPLTPLMPECETELQFLLSGHVEGTSERAKMAITTLALDDRAICHIRKELVDALIYTQEHRPEELRLLSDEKLQSLISVINQPDEMGQMLAFSPALSNIVRQLLINPAC
jgi:uncharacterized protein (TIGR02646 family)